MLTDAIESFATGTYTVTRQGSGTFTDGRYVEASTSTFSITACIQPQSARNLMVGPEGQSGDDVKILWTTTELKTRTPTTAPDVVTYKGEPWVVSCVLVWDPPRFPPALPPHYEVHIARRVTP